MVNETALRLYHRLPGGLRSLPATLWGWHLRRWRYGPESDALAAEALERESWSAERWHAWQQERLAYVLHRAATQVPFYRQHWQQRRRRGDRASWEVLANWPILERQSVRRSPHAFLAEDCDPRQMFPEHTSGTSGTPLQLWWSRRTVRAWYALFEARIRRWNGVDRDQRFAMLGGQLIAPPEQNRPPFWVWNGAMRQLYLSAYHLAPQYLQSYLEALETYRVRYLLGYPSAMHSLASYALERGLQTPALEVAISNGEPLYDDQRRSIGEAFSCATRETFGMAELACAASECPAGRLHVWPEVGSIEILDAEDRAAGEAMGRLVATGLLNADMPLIRYDSGNRGSLRGGGERCGCGHALPQVLAVEGRLDDLILTPDGRQVGRLDPVFKRDLPILEAQIVQEDRARLRLRVVPAAEFTAADSERLRRRLAQRLGDGMTIEVETVERIERAAAGKFRGVISRLDVGSAAGFVAPEPLRQLDLPATGAGKDRLRVLMITSEWPTGEAVHGAPFIVRQVRYLRRSGVEVEVLPFRGAGKVRNYWRGRRQVRALLESGRFDLVHAQWGQSALLALPRAVPLVVTFRGSDLEGLPDAAGRLTPGGRVLRGVSRFAARRADQVVVVSERLARHLPPRRYHVIPSGIDLTLFKPSPQPQARARLELSQQGPLVLFAASPENAIKRYPLARAAVDLLPADLGAELIVTEGVPHEHMPLYMSAADALLLTSFHEGSPNVVKEALACGLPVVSVDVGDVRQQVGGLEGCAVIDGESPQDLAAALERVLRRRRRVVAAGVVAPLDEALLVERLIEVYRQAVAR